MLHDLEFQYPLLLILKKKLWLNDHIFVVVLFACFLNLLQGYIAAAAMEYPHNQESLVLLLEWADQKYLVLSLMG